MQYLLRYLLSRRKALALAKSSNWMRQFIPNLRGGKGKNAWLPPRGTSLAVGRRRPASRWGVWYGSFTWVFATWLAPGLLGSSYLIMDEDGEGRVGAVGLVVSRAHLTVSDVGWWLTWAATWKG